MKWSLSLRVLIYLRRLTRAAESIAVSQRDMATVHRGQWEIDHPIKRKVTTDFGTLDVAEVNRRWEADREAEMIDEPSRDRV